MDTPQQPPSCSSQTPPTSPDSRCLTQLSQENKNHKRFPKIKPEKGSHHFIFLSLSRKTHAYHAKKEVGPPTSWLNKSMHTWARASEGKKQKIQQQRRRRRKDEKMKRHKKKNSLLLPRCFRSVLTPSHMIRPYTFSVLRLVKSLFRMSNPNSKPETREKVKIKLSFGG